MALVVTMPKLGLTMTSGSVAKWYKKEGDKVEKGEVILEVSTEKIAYKVEAAESGVIRKILVQPGVKVPIGTPLAIIAAPDEDINELLEEVAVPAEGKEEVKEVKPAVEASKSAAEEVFIRATPVAKKIAKEHGIDLTLVTGTGPKGRIVEQDVLNFIERQKAAVPAPSPAVKAAEPKRIPLSDVRQVIAERMSASWQNAPMVTLNADVDCSSFKNMRESLRTLFKEKGLNLSYNYILMKMCALALKEHPMLNSYLDGDEVVLIDEINIDLAVAIKDALILPVIKDVGDKDMFQIALEGGALIEKARKGELSIDDVTGGTFTITNLGMFGIKDFTPIINPPQCAILGVGEMKDKPCVCGEEIVIKPVMTLSLTFDHRIVDGAQAALFLRQLKEMIENPFILLTSLK